ncbi:MAG: gluconate transporter [Phycisphaerae bacterium SG8_4]|nr:MAG: gluconate transporter [Phycisphaerae bacterium SG8_4]
MSIVVLTVALLALVLAIVKFQVHPFLALLFCGLFLGLATGMPMDKTLDSLLDGFAGTLKWIGIVMVLGAVIGEILTETGGSFRIAESTLRLTGEKRVPFAMGLTGYVIAIPVFVDVAYIMLQPITEMLAVKSKRGIIVTGLSLTAGLTATHALLPPTPGPLAAAGLVGANLGKVILVNAFVAAFAVVGGLLWVLIACGKIELPYDRSIRDKVYKKESVEEGILPRPSLIFSLCPIFVPLLLIALASLSKMDAIAIPASSAVQFLGTPVIALLIGLALASLLLKKGGRMLQLRSIVERSIEKAASVIMITGAGGALGGVIKASTIGSDVSTAITGLGIPGLLLPFLLAAGLTTATGSLTVSMVTTSSIVASMLGSLEMSPEMAVALIGAGSFCVFHANASFFWLLNRLHEIPPNVLYRTYSLQSLCMGLCGLVAVILLRLVGVR